MEWHNDRLYVMKKLEEHSTLHEEHRASISKVWKEGVSDVLEKLQAEREERKVMAVKVGIYFAIISFVTVFLLNTFIAAPLRQAAIDFTKRTYHDEPLRSTLPAHRD